MPFELAHLRHRSIAGGEDPTCLVVAVRLGDQSPKTQERDVMKHVSDVGRHCGQTLDRRTGRCANSVGKGPQHDPMTATPEFPE
jgi:hypothetical protein